MISVEELVQTTAIEASEVCEVLSGETAIDRTLQIEMLVTLLRAHVRDRVISTVLLSAQEHPQGASSLLRDEAERLRQLQCVAPPGFIAPAATLLRIVAWQAGEGATATCALERAVANDPDYRLAPHQGSCG
jgi:hypothetical protein